MHDDTARFFELFPDEEAARRYFELRRWRGRVTCPACGGTKRIGVLKRGRYRCRACGVEFSVRTGTALADSKIPLCKWLCALYLFASRRIGSPRLGREIGVSQKAALHMLRRIRAAQGAEVDTARGAGGRGALARVADTVLAHAHRPMPKHAAVRQPEEPPTSYGWAVRLKMGYRR